ncbi:PH domain-containing protein [Candidatus Poriferisocius sp.]|uniref:PH domain-containing protein n=1 Tax=Candidatus Poriferisocius sp. TaxID=3101276 RepID=UPI003B5C1005
MTATIEEVTQRLQALGIARLKAVRREIAALVHILEDDEHIEGATGGMVLKSPGLAICTNRRVLLLNVSRSKMKQKGIPLESISSVDLEIKRRLGTLELVGPGLADICVTALATEAQNMARAIQAARNKHVGDQ